MRDFNSSFRDLGEDARQRERTVTSVGWFAGGTEVSLHTDLELLVKFERYRTIQCPLCVFRLSTSSVTKCFVKKHAQIEF